MTEIDDLINDVLGKPIEEVPTEILEVARKARDYGAELDTIRQNFVDHFETDTVAMPTKSLTGFLELFDSLRLEIRELNEKLDIYGTICDRQRIELRRLKGEG